MKKLFLILITAFALSLSSKSQTCNPVTPSVSEVEANGFHYVNVAWGIYTTCSIFVDGVIYKDGNVTNFTGAYGYNMSCEGLGEHHASDIITVVVRRYCGAVYPVNYADAVDSAPVQYTFKNDFLCPVVKGHRGGKKK